MEQPHASRQMVMLGRILLGVAVTRARLLWWRSLIVTSAPLQKAATVQVVTNVEAIGSYGL
jgi:hypothetical protein